MLYNKSECPAQAKVGLTHKTGVFLNRNLSSFSGK